MPNATTNNSLSKICNPKWPIRQPPLSKMWEIAFPTPVRIDAPESAQSNSGRGPRRGTVAHVHRKVHTGYNGTPQIRPQKYAFPWTDPQTPLPTWSLDPSDLRWQTSFGSDPPFFHNALDRPTDGPTHRLTDRPQKSLITIGRCATREMRPKI